MDEAMLLTLAVAVVVLVLAAATTRFVVRGRRRLERELTASRADVDALRRQVESLSRQVAPDHKPTRVPREFLITSLPDGPSSEVAVPDPRPAMGAGRFASVALGESLVRLISLGYGVGRALSPENRNRIRFAMRQEVKRARRQRRRDLREARRHLRTQPGGERADVRSDAA